MPQNVGYKSICELTPAPNLHNCARTRLLFEVLITRVEVVEVKNKLEKLLKE